MDEDERLRRGSSFGAAAEAYDEHRPGYPHDAIRWALQPATLRPAGRDLAGLKLLDLGAGTGKLTTRLAALGVCVTAVEPDAEMLAALARLLPSVPAYPGSAEAIPLPDGSVDAVLCGQSMHWFNLERALPEIARVLAPGGVLAGLWNSDDDRVEWVAGLHVAAEGSASPTVSTRRDETADIGRGKNPGGGDDGGRSSGGPSGEGDGSEGDGTGDKHSGVWDPYFGPREIAEFGNGHQRTAESLLATVATHSKFLTMPSERREEVLGRVRDYLASQPETADGEFTLPMVTSVLRTTRLP
ncbi:MAG TPA: class I SAM-dependent methyltransferase [Trebonia sp.]